MKNKKPKTFRYNQNRCCVRRNQSGDAEVELPIVAIDELIFIYSPLTSHQWIQISDFH